MRVIGGKFKGKKLIEPRDKETRPLKDLTKESIFNIINHSNKFSIDLKKEVETGKHGTQKYVLKQGPNKGKVL